MKNYCKQMFYRPVRHILTSQDSKTDSFFRLLHVLLLEGSEREKNKTKQRPVYVVAKALTVSLVNVPCQSTVAHSS